MDRAVSTAFALTAPLFLAACASTGDFPSLAIRDAERVQGTIAAPPAPPAPPSPETVMQVDSLMQRVRSGHAAFEGEVAAATRAANAARGAAMGSEAWSVAQVALAVLESKRSEVMIALADLDRIMVDASNAGQDLAVISAASAEANALVQAENAAVARIGGTIGN